MTELDKPSAYSLSNLHSAIRLPWKEFAAWADPWLPPVYWIRKPSEFLFEHGYHMLSPNWSSADLTDWRQVCIQAITYHLDSLALSGLAVFSKILGEEYFHAQVELPSITEGLFEKRQDFDALLKLISGTLRGGDYEAQKELEDAYGFPPPLGIPRCAVRPDNLDQLRLALVSPRELEASFWQGVQQYSAMLIPDLLEIDHALRKGAPLQEHHVAILNHYCSLGHPACERTVTGSGAIQVTVSFRPGLTTSPKAYLPHDVWWKVSSRLFVPFAYELTLAYAGSQPWPRHIIPCRNPFCDRTFYSGRARAVACPSPIEGRRSECKATWDAYQKWLKKIGEDPDKAWYDKQLEEDFKAQYRPRGSQSGMLQ